VKQKIISLLLLILLFFHGCATVAQRPVPTPPPLSKTEQLAAQESQKVPETKRYKIKIAIGRFTNETNYGRALLNPYDLDRIGKQASDMLASRLIMSEKFIVLERPDLQKVKVEQVISDISDMNIIGADTLVIGSVTEFGRSVSGKEGFLSSTKMQLARAKVDIRLIDVKTGHAYFSAIGAGEASTEAGEIAGFGSRADYDATLNDRAIAAAISNVIDSLISKMNERRWRTDILEIKDQRVFISGGKHQGLKEGDTLLVLEPGETVKSQQTGFDVILPAKQVATIKVVELFGETETNEGSVCEIILGSIDKANSKKLFVAEPKQGGAK